MNIVLLGAPGCGKGFVSSMIIDEYGYKHISTGNLLRENIKNKTKLGEKIEKYMTSGELVPDDLVLQVLQDALNRVGSNNIIFDGYPRRVEQAIELDKLCKIDLVINVEVPTDIVLDRLSSRRVCVNCNEVYSIKTYTDKVCAKCGADVVQRSDDNPKVIKNRLKKYEEQTKPLIDFYKKQNKLVGLDNSGNSTKTLSLLKNIINSHCANVQCEEERV